MSGVITKKKTWREHNQEKRKRKTDRVIKKLDKINAKKVEVPIKTIPKEKEKVSISTWSIALPGSILENAQTQELRTYLVGQIARAACIYKVNEIIVFDDSGGTEVSKYCLQFARLLQYLECPQYLRKHFFPIHKDLQFIGLLNPLDAPHHLRQNEESEYREGITTQKPTKTGKGCYVNVGLVKDVKIGEKLEPGLRVTVKLYQKAEGSKWYGNVVSPEEPFRDRNLYWGYSVRVAHSLSQVLTKCPYPGGYDLTIGTSDKGQAVDGFQPPGTVRHGLVVFGGLKGLEAALESDELPVEHPSLLFDCYLNTCPEQGSRTIRTEEAVLITLAELRKLFKR